MNRRDMIKAFSSMYRPEDVLPHRLAGRMPAVKDRLCCSRIADDIVAEGKSEPVR